MLDSMLSTVVSRILAQHAVTRFVLELDGRLQDIEAVVQQPLDVFPQPDRALLGRRHDVRAQNVATAGQRPDV